FRHRDAGHLGELLTQHAAPPATPLVLTDGVFAISGSIAPVADYHAQLARYERAYLCVDDAHAAGVLGDAGRGSFEHANLPNVNASLADDGAPGTRLLASATLSKALGGFGGIIAGAQTFIDTIKQQSHLFNGA